MKQAIKVGDLVRVPGPNASSIHHHFKQGQVVEVVGVHRDALELEGLRGSCMLQQGLYASDLKLAKQAMRKRDAYAKRRG